MSRRELDDLVASAKQHFEEGLIRAGFHEEEAAWVGNFLHGDESTEVQITIPVNFPFSWPRVRPSDPNAVPWSWHRELDGALCLVSEDDHDGLWWREASDFLEHVAAWFAAADSGWSQDCPDLDIDRYFVQSDDKRLYLFGDLDAYSDSFVRFRPGPNNTMELRSRGRQPERITRKFRFDKFGYEASRSSLELPPRGWVDLAKLATASVDLEKLIKRREITVLLLRYMRASQQGSIALEVWPGTNGDIQLRRLRSATTAPVARLIRSGPYAALLAERRIAIVGVGAVGSLVADMLVRGGVRRLTLLDGDIVKPGNLVRHVLGSESIGLSKAEGVKAYLVARHDIGVSNIDARGDLLLASENAYELISTHDLVVNATADYAVTALLHVAAEADGQHVLSVALQNSGQTLRVDVLPPISGESLPDSEDTRSVARVENFEAGCGSPISPTPPFAVMEAAAVAVRHAGLLVGAPLHPAGEVRHLAAEGRVHNGGQ